MLSNGYYERGFAFSGGGTVFGEFVFVTAMSGYEEVMTDPSYKGQIIVFTYPLMGNYGITGEDGQSADIHAEAIVIRENTRSFSNHRAKMSLSDFLTSGNKTGVERIDTRALTKQIRMTSCSHKAELTSFYAIDKKPVGFYVAFSTIFQDSFELMIFIFCRQFLSTGQTSNGLFQFV